MSIEEILKRLKEENRILVKKAYDFLISKLDLNNPESQKIIIKILRTLNTLIDFKADCLTLISSILYYTANNEIEEVSESFSNDVSIICQALSLISNLENIGDYNEIIKLLNNFQRESIVDVRIFFIYFAEKLSFMRIGDPTLLEEQKVIASYTLNNLVPIASKLGLNYIKSNVEDVCLSYLEPVIYQKILERLGDSPANLKVSLNKMMANISDILRRHNIEFKIKGRVKNIYSIYTKMLRGKTWEEIYDIMALRILVNKESDCSSVLELIHSSYKYIPERLKDYISNPKENMYQSLHTTIYGDDGRPYEIQIRTHEMNKTAEDGKASHRLYKEGTNRNI